MQWVGRHYVPYFNRKYGRAGTLWQGRFKATVIDAANYLMSCTRYIELNPVRSGIAANPGDYAWSSYAHHIGAKSDPSITDHPLFWALGNTPFEREAAYKDLAEQALAPEDLQELKETARKGWGHPVRNPSRRIWKRNWTGKCALVSVDVRPSVCLTASKAGTERCSGSAT